MIIYTGRVAVIEKRISQSDYDSTSIQGQHKTYFWSSPLSLRWSRSTIVLAYFKRVKISNLQPYSSIALSLYVLKFLSWSMYVTASILGQIMTLVWSWKKLICNKDERIAFFNPSSVNGIIYVWLCYKSVYPLIAITR